MRLAICSLLLLTAFLPAAGIADEASKSAKLAELVQLSGMAEVIEDQRAQGRAAEATMRDQVIKQLSAENPNASDQFWQSFDVAFSAYESANSNIWSSKELTDSYAAEYGKRVSERDLDKILEYYKSPAGRKDVLASKQAMTAWTASLLPRAQKIGSDNLRMFLDQMKQAAQTCGAIKNDQRKNCLPPSGI